MDQTKKFALLRIAFGFVWTIDAFFKWQPAFLNGLGDMLNSMLDGQPVWVQGWINLWIQIVNVNPHLFAVLVAIIETVVALSLIFGFLTRITLVGCIAFSFLIWSIGEGFGGPYTTGSTDIGCAVIYIFVAVALLFGASWRTYSLDEFFRKKYPNFCLWKDKGAVEVQKDSKDKTIQFLILGIIILGSIIIASHIPQTLSLPSDQSMGTGPGAMAPMGMTLKTFDLKPSDPVPAVSFTITKDPVAMGGWDVHITTTNFTFTPEEAVNRAPVADEGHAHLYVDDKMYVVYSNWYHLDDIAAGQHMITVSLMANDHSVFEENGKYVEATTTIAE